MPARWLIVADDLTGAADCAIAFAKCGLDSVVAWGRVAHDEAMVLSIDADSRRCPPAEASERQRTALAAHWRPGTRVYKKIDSTLRGQPAAELAALLGALSAASGYPPPLAIVAPAFPATGRVTLGGRVIVNGVALEETPLWARDHTYASAFLTDVLASAGVVAATIELHDVRAGVDALHGQMTAAAKRAGAVVCDCGAEADLGMVAAASLRLDDALWVGSAGLAAALAELVAPAGSVRPKAPSVAGGILVVVGSLAEASRQQARTLVETGLRHVAVSPDTLFTGPGTAEWSAALRSLAEGLHAGQDVLLEIAMAAEPNLALGPQLADRLSLLVDAVTPLVGAVVATGGETACAVLSRLGIHGIRLVDEVEPGVPLGLTLGALSIPVVTKAGAFGDAGTLRRSVDRIRG